MNKTVVIIMVCAVLAYLAAVEWSAHKCRETGGRLGNVAWLECVR